MNETEQAKLLATPLGFCEGVLALPCYDCIKKVLLDLDAPGQVSVAAANGIGKSSRIGAPAAIWNAAVHPGSLTIVSAVFIVRSWNCFSQFRPTGASSRAGNFSRIRFAQIEARAFWDSPVTARNYSRVSILRIC